jgi:IPT/TIG domain
MILAAALVASCQCLASEPISSSADVAQDSSWLYVSSENTLQRILKATGERAAIAPPSTRQIAAIDVDGPAVYYGTRTSISTCSWVNDIGGCTDDGQSANEIVFVPATGGMPTVLVNGVRSVVGISHDVTSIYWVEASTRTDTAAAFLWKSDALIRRIDKRTGVIDTVASGLTIRNYDSNLVAFDDAFVYYTDSGARLVRYAKSDGVTTTVLPSWGGPLVIDDTHIYSDTVDEAVPKSGGFRFQWIDRLRIPDQRGVFTVVGAGGGRLIYSTFYAEHRTTFGTFYLYDFCSGTSTVLGGSPSPSTSFAIDSCAVYIGANNYSPFCAAVPVRITSVVPPTAPASGGTVITVTGSGFLWSATADIDGARAPIQSLTSTRIELVTPSNTPRGTFLPLGSFLRIDNGDGSCVAVPFVYFSNRRRVATSR